MRRTVIRPGVARVLLLSVAVLPALLFTVPAAAQSGGEDVMRRVEVAFGRGDARALLEMASDRLDIALFGSSTQFSRGQAAYVLESFFQKYPPRGCDLQESRRADGSWFAAGRYTFERGARPLHLYVGLRLRGGTWELREIRVHDPSAP